MDNWLNPDNKFFTFMGKAFDTLVLNTLWLLLCVPLPVLTVVWIAKTENFLAVKKSVKFFNPCLNIETLVISSASK